MKRMVTISLLLALVACSANEKREPEAQKDPAPQKKIGQREPAARAKKEQPKAAPKKSPKKSQPDPKKSQPDPKKGPKNKSPVKAPERFTAGAKEGDQGRAKKATDFAAPEDDDRGAKLKILQGLLAQRNRRIAGLHREIAAIKRTADAEQLLAARALEELARSKKANFKLSADLVRARKGLPSIGKPNLDEKTDERFLIAGSMDPKDIVARVNGEAVYRGDLLYRLYYNHGFSYFESFIKVKLVEQEAARLKIKVSQKDCIIWASRQMAQASAKNGGDEKFRARLKKEGQSFALYEAMLRFNAQYFLQAQKIIALQRQSPEGKVKLEKQARMEYDRRYTPSVRASHIFFPTKAKAQSPEWQVVFRKAESVLKKIRDGAKFKDMAKTFSQDVDSRGNGGRLGLVDRQRYSSLPVFNNALFTLPVNELQLVPSRAGIHVVKVTDIVAPTLSWPQAKAKILRELKASGASRLELDQLLLAIEKKSSIKRLFKLR
jgi:hypothetical protein